MLIESLTMEEKQQLDLNRPLLSVRRPTQASEQESKATNKTLPPTPPVYKSDIKSGPVRNPGTVPFQWEHKPGKPKEDSQTFVETHYVPKLPPGRVREGEVSSSVVRKPETRVNHMEDAKSYDNTYDAADMLSRSESFFFNCSNVSGHGKLVEPFGTLLSDRQTQDLMMGRFLPAAKALTSESPPTHLARKPPKPEEPVKVVVVKKKQNKAGVNPYRFRHSPEQQEEGADIGSMLGFGVLNPVPSVRMQAHRAVSVRRMRSKYQDCNESHSKNNESVNEDMMKLSSAPEAKEKVKNACRISTTPRSKVSKNFGELLSSDDNTWKPSPVVEKTLYVDTVHSVDKKVQEDSKENPSIDVVQNMIRPGEEAIKRDEDLTEECHDHAIVALPESKVVLAEVTKEKIDLEAKFQRNTSSRVHQRSTYHIVPPPPLPKAPSDSWLKRTLPTIPSKNNSFTWLQSLGDDNNKINQANPKWETMVKTSNTQQGFVFFSKESLNPIPEA